MVFQCVYTKVIIPLEAWMYEYKLLLFINTSHINISYNNNSRFYSINKNNQ